ncbi:MAG TPA: adenylate/guanylate cyclase domain-containing protein [Gemmataceae bacterium]|nr:adenylate/guanylate cyclase domain-containing protein [Gemmataceae bacterium]
MSGERGTVTGRSEENGEVAVAAERTRTAWLASKRQELLAPAGAILELCEMLLRDACDREHEGFLADVRNLHRAGASLQGLVRGLLDAGENAASDREAARRARHDLRTPLTEILGLCEHWLEDAKEQLLEGFAGDLRAIHALGRRLLQSLDDLVGFNQVASDPDIDLNDPCARVIRDIVEDLPVGNSPAEKGTILVVDDNEVNREVLRRRLAREGHCVTLAANGCEALEKLQAEPFDLVLLDIIMPGLNGCEVLQRIKADGRLRHVPVIMISAFSEVDAVARCIEAGAEDYLPRPFNPTLLRARIGACLEKKRLRDREQMHLAQIERERERADGLLHVILPGPAVRELKETNAVRPRRFDGVAVLFCDIVGFTPFCDGNAPEHVVAHLQSLIEGWEEAAQRNDVQKIKTIGDAFMAAGGLLEQSGNPVLACLRCGLEMIAVTRALGVGWDLRVGVHVGPVVAGVIGRRQYLFDLWGDTVNTAARMESHGTPGHVTLSGDAWDRVADVARGEWHIVEVKGKGPMKVFQSDGFLGSPGVPPAPGT